MLAPELENLIKLIARLPGLGPRSARRVALHLMKKQEGLMIPLANALRQAGENLQHCSQCHNIDVTEICSICQDTTRNQTQICIVSDVSDVWALERTSFYKGQYHILGGVLSAIEGITPEDLNIHTFQQRVMENSYAEIILALPATVDGQTTSHVIKDMIGTSVPRITRLSHGVPVGGELDYLDDGTLTTALKSRS